ncbi:pyruvate dehydrogenase [Mycoplasma sp. ES3157-GEN-MYC]|uniref:2-oxoisovalerate dehydrogenase subunit alpha n=1 Tax=Mycoplasma miroungigenitalium TaxID=754515 RepID=A0A6M4J933_9MOLU|nr:thiamine pyrophosphate-dependent enzyme [Mycoplasma miroungigenitalium]MBU4690419.1 pyruvate dehydrogenase [Mycoplasma miroungigenitalium]MBU4691686.1 pyruvate dehydrogenase [Mycoplasma miroungigenitalium]QJR43513.1 pyruvate dehydrogenase [Mycoplasma miroungigenitalium]
MKFKFIEEGKVMTCPDAMVRFLDINGDLIDKSYKPTASKELLRDMYKNMIRSRSWDNYALTLQKTGRLGTFAPMLGEEAFLSALGFVMKKDDWFIPHYRVLATLLARGESLESVYLYWRGSELGSKFKSNIVPMQVIIGSQISQAAGVAKALKVAGKGQVAFTTIGNGGTNEGEFHEGLNWASLFNLPVVFVISNNRWAISVPEHNSYKVKTLSQRAMSYGLPGLRVDGNDLLAAHEVLSEAAEWAREGHGPVLIEMVTWRQGQHTTSDDPRVYRTREEEIEHEKWEPFHRIEKYLFDNGIVTEKEKETWTEEATEAAKLAYDKSTEMIATEGYDDIFKYTYETLPEELVEQQEAFRRFIK